MANLPTSIKNLNTLLGEQLTEGGGGGGSSDFSTAEVTVNDSVGHLMYGAFVDESWGFVDPKPLTIGVHYSDDYDYTKPFSVVMYKGMAVVRFDINEEVTITATGNATVDLNEVFITGDCTITIA